MKKMMLCLKFVYFSSKSLFQQISPQFIIFINISRISDMWRSLDFLLCVLILAAMFFVCDVCDYYSLIMYTVVLARKLCSPSM